jgi:predicted ATPase/class 3 adenylate cyclase
MDDDATTQVSTHAPAGTSTFLFTDIVDSSVHWDTAPGQMRAALAIHDALLAASINAAGGHVVKHTGDGVMAAFHTVGEAITAAVSAQLELARTDWDTSGALALEVRMGIHTGEAESRADDYFGLAVNRAARLMSAAQGGQILLSEIAATLGRDAGLPAGIDLAQHQEIALKGVARRERPLQVLHSGLRTDFAPLRSPATRTATPEPLTEMIGRDDHVESALASIATARLLTITGYGGVGKTRLAIAIADRADQVVDDGVSWVDLAPVGDPAAIVHAIAAVVVGAGVSGVDPIEAIVDSLTGRDTLIVLDDCERLAADVGRLVRSLLDRCPTMRIVATSRVPLGVRGERLLRLDPLDTHAETSRGRSPAVELFVERARSSSHDFELTDDNVDAVIELCRHLDGLPLAIELAAARVRSMPPGQILRRLDDRFRLLDDRRSSTEDRHSSMRRTLEWSYELLDPMAQLLFDRLSLFIGGISIEAAETVCGDDGIDTLEIVELLAQLVDHSMLATSPDAGSHDARYHLGETFRAFGLQRLSEQHQLERCRERFARHWLAVAEGAHQGIRGRDEGVWRRTITREFANLRSTHSILIADGDVDGALRLSLALGEYSFFGLHTEVSTWIDAALAMDGARDHASAIEARALAVVLAWTKGAWPTIEGHLEHLDAVLDPEVPSTSYRVEFARGLVAAFRGRMDEQCDRYERCLDLALADGDAFRSAIISGQLAFARSFIGRDDATVIGERAVAIADRLGNATASSTALWGLGTTLVATDPRRAQALFAESTRAARDAEVRLNEISSESSALIVTDRSASPTEQLVFLSERWQYWHDTGNAPMRWYMIRKLALTLLRLGEPRAAAVMLGAEAAATLRLAPNPGDERRLERARAQLHDELGTGATADLMALGATIDRVGFNGYVTEALSRALAAARRQQD